MKKYDWRDDAVCAQVDPETWYPEKGASHLSKAARKVCNSVCPVRNECLDYALENNIEYGIWGGMTENERREYKRLSIVEVA